MNIYSFFEYFFFQAIMEIMNNWIKELKTTANLPLPLPNTHTTHLVLAWTTHTRNFYFLAEITSVGFARGRPEFGGARRPALLVAALLRGRRAEEELRDVVSELVIVMASTAGQRRRRFEQPGTDDIARFRRPRRRAALRDGRTGGASGMARGGSAHAQLRRGAGPRGEGGLAAPCPGHARHGGVAAQAHGDGKRSWRAAAAATGLSRARAV